VVHEGPNFGRAAAAGCLLRTTLRRLTELRWFVTLLKEYSANPGKTQIESSKLPADW
jgi:hypothetical protein